MQFRWDIESQFTYAHFGLKIVHRMTLNQSKLAWIEENCAAVRLVATSFFVQCFGELQRAQFVVDLRQMVAFHLLHAENVRRNVRDFSGDSRQSMWPVQCGRIVVCIEAVVCLEMCLRQNIV